jgi:kynurenine formamidase
MSRFVFLVVLALASSSHGDKVKKQPFIDLSYAFNNETVTWPGRTSTFNVEIEGETPDGVWIASRGFCTSEHTATHIDAPYHFHKAGRKLDQIPLEDLIDTPGVMIDIYDKVHRMINGNLTVVENYVLTRQDVQDWERKNGVIKPGSIVLLRTGWGERWPDVKAFRGIHDTPAGKEKPEEKKTDGEPASVKVGDLGLNFPGYDATAAKYLTVERGVLGVGTDAISIDAGANSRFFPAHQIFASRSVWMLEMVANLHLLPPRGFNLWVVPFKIDQGTGAPTRVLARIHN